MPRTPMMPTSVLMCPHGGTVQIAASANLRVKLSGVPLLLASDFSKAVIAGCVNQPPCTQIEWLQNPQVLLCGQPSAWYPPGGICLGAGLPQGMVVAVVVPSPITGA